MPLTATPCPPHPSETSLSPYESSGLISLCQYRMSGLFVSQPLQVWNEDETLLDSSCLLLERFSLLASLKPAFFSVERTLSSRSDFSLSRQNAALAHLDSLFPHDLDRCLYSFPLANAALASLPAAHFVTPRPPCSFRQLQSFNFFH